MHARSARARLVDGWEVKPLTRLGDPRGQTMKLLCMLVRHRWVPADPGGGGPLTLICARCGRTQSFGDETHEHRGSAELAELRYRAAGR